MVKCWAMVKVVTIDDWRMLSDDLSEPGVEPLFLITITSRQTMASNYLTDGHRIWYVSEFWPVYSSTSTVMGSAYKVFGDGETLIPKNMKEARRAIKRYVESL